MKGIFLIFTFMINLSYAYEYKCEYAIFPPNTFLLDSTDKYQTLTIEEGVSSKSSLNHSINQVFYKVKATNKEYSQFTLSDSLNFSDSQIFVKKLSLGSLMITLERLSADEVYLKYRIVDKLGLKSFKFNDGIVSEEKYVKVNLGLGTLDPQLIINCYYLPEITMNQSSEPKAVNENKAPLNPSIPASTSKQ